MQNDLELAARQQESHRLFLEQFRLEHDLHSPEIENRSVAADEMSRLVLNALLLLNGGALIALPSLKDYVDRIFLERAAYALVVGLVAALFSATIAIWNYRYLVAKVASARNVRLRKVIEMHGYGSGSGPSEDQTHLKAIADATGKLGIPLTVWFGWSFGIISLMAFISAASLLCLYTH